MPRALFIALANPSSPADADEFDKWYENTHVPELLTNVDRLVSGTRYRVTDIEMLPGLTKSAHRHLAIYEVDADTEAELEQTADELRKVLTSGALNMSPTLDMGSAMAMFVLPIGAPQQSPNRE